MPNKRRKVRKSVVFFLIVFILLISLAGGLFLYNNVFLKPKASTILIYDFISNKEVYVIRDGSSSKAYRGMRLREGDRVYTDFESKVYLKLDDNKNVLLDYNTEIAIENYKNKELVIKLIKGQFFFDVTTKLQANETMKFKIANTTMSIRGTSGAGINEYGEGKFMIFSGKGEIESASNNLMLLPTTKIVFTTDGAAKDPEVAMVNVNDIPSVFYDYLTYSKEYPNELKENGWNETVPPKELKGDEYLGWVQKEDGSWMFSIDNYQNGVGIQNYKVTKPNNLKVLNTTYNGEMQTPAVEGFDENFMVLESVSYKNAGTYEIKVSPKTEWSDGTKSEIKLNWTIEPKKAQLEIENARKEYKSKDPEFKATIKGIIDGDKFEYKLVREQGEDLGNYRIYPEWNKDRYPNYELVFEDAYLSVYTTFEIKAKEESYSYPYDGFYNGPDDPVTVSDNKDTVLHYSLNGIDWQNDPVKVIDSGKYTVYVKASNERYEYEPECTYTIEITKTHADARATGYYNQKSIDMTAEVKVPSGVEFTAAYYLYEINDFRLNREKATLISRIVANGTYVAYPEITILDENYITDIKYTKVTVKSMLFHIYSNDYYDDLNSLIKSYTPE